MMFRSFLSVWLVIIAAAFHANPVRAQAPAGELYSGPIIDMHIHAYGEANPLYGATHPPTLRGETYPGVSSPGELKEKVLAQFRKHRIVKAVVTSGELWLADLPGTILIANADKSPEDLKTQHAEGKLQVLAEMAPFYEGIRADDPSQAPWFELAQELGIPVGFHIFPGGPNSGIHHMPGFLGKTRTYNAYPSQLEEVLVKYPGLKIYVMHGGWPHVAEMKALMYAHPKLYADVAVLNWILPQQEVNNYLKSMIDAGFGDRIMYGSDQMVWPQLISVGIESINAVDFLTLEQKEDIFYDNAAKFLGLTAEEISEHKRRYAR